MTTPISRRFSVNTELLDKVATVDTLNRVALITTNDIFSGARYSLVTPDDWKDRVPFTSFPEEYNWLTAHFGQDGGSPADAYVVYWNKAATGDQAETIAQALDDAISKGVSWYQLQYIGKTAAVIPDQIAIAEYVQSSEQKMQAMFLTNSAVALNDTGATDIGLRLRTLSMERSGVIYHPTGQDAAGNEYDAQRPDAAIGGKMIWRDAGAEQWDYHALTLVSDANLSAGQQAVLRAKGYNFIETFTNTTFTHMYKGRLVTDREIRIQWGADWFDNNLQASLANFAFRAGLMAFDFETFNAVEALIRSWLDRALRRRIILEGYTVNMPDPDTFTASERASGKAVLNNIYRATLNSAIDDWTVTGQWVIGGE